MFRSIDIKLKDEAVRLRKKGYSLTEIKNRTGISKCTLSYLMRNISLSKKSKKILYQKKFKSKEDAQLEWLSAFQWARKEIGSLSKRDKLIILAMIYWGEGTKKELNIINSDPDMLRVFIKCLSILKVNKDDIRISLRLFPQCNVNQSKTYWADMCDISVEKIKNIEFVQGSKKHKHLYGMCRIRVIKSALYFKKIISMINCIKTMPL